MLKPGACSPSLKVVSKIAIRSISSPYVKRRLVTYSFCGMLFRPRMSEDPLQKDLLKTFYDFFARARSGRAVPLVCPIQHAEQREGGQYRIHIFDAVLPGDVGNQFRGHPHVLFL